jgi:hypothetical protein
MPDRITEQSERISLPRRQLQVPPKAPVRPARCVKKLGSRTPKCRSADTRPATFSAHESVQDIWCVVHLGPMCPIDLPTNPKTWGTSSPTFLVAFGSRLGLSRPQNEIVDFRSEFLGLDQTLAHLSCRHGCRRHLRPGSTKAGEAHAKHIGPARFPSQQSK